MSVPIDPALLQRADASQGEQPAEASDESEWEYEYDSEQTETFYLPIELNSLREAQRPQRKRKLATDGQPSSNSDHVDTAEDIQDRSLSETDSIQVLDLHSSNPLIVYGNQLYSCQWASSIGTDLLFTGPDELPPSLPSLKKTKDYNLISANTLRLGSRPVRLVPRQTQDQENATGTEPKIPLPPKADRAMQDQARFLERLIALKKARGESDEVTVNAKKTWLGTGWRAQSRLKKEAQRRKEEEEAQRHEDEQRIS